MNNEERDAARGAWVESRLLTLTAKRRWDELGMALATVLYEAYDAGYSAAARDASVLRDHRQCAECTRPAIDGSDYCNGCSVKRLPESDGDKEGCWHASDIPPQGQ